MYTFMIISLFFSPDHALPPLPPFEVLVHNPIVYLRWIWLCNGHQVPDRRAWNALHLGLNLSLGLKCRARVRRVTETLEAWARISLGRQTKGLSNNV